MKNIRSNSAKASQLMHLFEKALEQHRIQQQVLLLLPKLQVK